MGWVNDTLKELKAGHSVKIRPHGGSMRGRIESGQEVTLSPVKPEELVVDDVVLVRWKGNFLLHLIKEINGDQILIGNNIDKENGWVTSRDVFGKVTEVND